MLEFKSISAGDFERYNKYRAVDPTNASEGVFATMFIWNDYYNLEVAENGEFFFIRFNIRNKKPSYFFPIGKGSVENAVKELSDYSLLHNERLSFRLVSAENVEKLKRICGKRFSFTEDRDCFDYVYVTEKMISLSGKKLHSKRNHLNYFFDNYDFEYLKVDDEKLLKECSEKAQEWVFAKKKNRNSFELGAMKKYFDHYFEFKQKGAVIKIDGKIAAMSFGEKLNSNMALIQVELADENFRGAYQAINKLFCENEWKDCMYVNREEDMGIDGLRRAKTSYQPEFLVEKFIVEEEI